MPGRIEPGERGPDPDSYLVVEHGTEQQVYVEDCTGML